MRCQRFPSTIPAVRCGRRSGRPSPPKIASDTQPQESDNRATHNMIAPNLIAVRPVRRGR
jgi:hypothetical protein